MQVTLEKFERAKEAEGLLAKKIDFHILERQGTVYIQIVNNVKGDTLIATIKEHISPGSIIYSDTLAIYHKVVGTRSLDMYPRKPLIR